jgi:hypothetical protein
MLNHQDATETIREIAAGISWFMFAAGSLAAFFWMF